MSRTARSAESGQTMTDYALLLAAIAVVCLLALLLLGGAIGDLFGSTATPLTARPAETGAFVPPSTSPELVYPTTLEECENGGWRNYVQFDDEAACKAYIDGLTP